MSSSSASSRAMTSPMTAASFPSGGSRPPMTWIAPRTPANGFLTSWATTAAISPSFTRVA